MKRLDYVSTQNFIYLLKKCFSVLEITNYIYIYITLCYGTSRCIWEIILPSQSRTSNSLFMSREAIAWILVYSLTFSI